MMKAMSISQRTQILCVGSPPRKFNPSGIAPNAPFSTLSYFILQSIFFPHSFHIHALITMHSVSIIGTVDSLKCPCNKGPTTNQLVPNVDKQNKQKSLMPNVTMSTKLLCFQDYWKLHNPSIVTGETNSFDKCNKNLCHHNPHSSSPLPETSVTISPDPVLTELPTTTSPQPSSQAPTRNSSCLDKKNIQVSTQILLQSSSKTNIKQMQYTLIHTKLATYIHVRGSGI